MAVENAFLACNNSTKLILCVIGNIKKIILTKAKDSNCKLWDLSLDKRRGQVNNRCYICYKYKPTSTLHNTYGGERGDERK